MSSKTRNIEDLRFAAISCSHAPHTSRKWWQWALDQIKDHDPHVLAHLGDLLDADAASRWDSDEIHTLHDEFRVAEKQLEELKNAAGNARAYVYIQGNHEHNMLAEPKRIHRKLRPFIIDAFAALHDGWVSVPYGPGEAFNLGPVTFRHGVKCGQKADLQEAVLYGWDNSLSVMGHTHRPIEPTRVILPGQIPLRRWYANVGTLVDPAQLSYAKRINYSTWGPAVLVGSCKSRGEGRQTYSTRQWTAELRSPGLWCDISA